MKYLPFLKEINSQATIENLIKLFKTEVIGKDLCVTQSEINAEPKFYILISGTCRVE